MEIKGMKLVACSMHFYYGTFSFAAPCNEDSDSTKHHKVQQKNGAKQKRKKREKNQCEGEEEGEEEERMIRASELGRFGWAAGKINIQSVGRQRWDQ